MDVRILSADISESRTYVARVGGMDKFSPHVFLRFKVPTQVPNNAWIASIFVADLLPPRDYVHTCESIEKFLETEHQELWLFELDKNHRYKLITG